MTLKFRRKTLFLLSIPTILGSVLIMVSVCLRSFEAIIFGRFIVGLSAGIRFEMFSNGLLGAYTVVTPTYLSEIAPVKSRGAAGVMNQFVTVLAILLSQVLGLSQVMGTDKFWPFLLGNNIIFMIPFQVFVLLFVFCM